MATKIDIKHSSTPGAIPTTSSINLGEIAINTYDGKAYIKKDDGTQSIIELGSGGGGGTPGGPNTSIQFNKNNTFSGSSNFTFNSGSNQVSLTGSMDLAGYVRFDPVTTNIDQSISASYIYVSGSTNDLYFTQNGQGYANTTRLRWLEGNLYTGLLNGGIVSASIGGTTYQISSGSGVIVNLNASYNNNPYPSVQYLNWSNLSASIAPLSASYDQSFIGINSSLQITASGIPYSDGDYNTLIPIGIVIHQNRSTINATQTFPGVAYGWKQRSFDFIKAFGPLKISGYTLSQSGSSARGLLLAGGVAWVDGRNYIVDPNNPSYITEAVGIATSKIYRYRQSGSGWAYDTNGGIGYTDIDPTQYSNNGLLTPVGTNDWSLQRVFYFPNSATKALYIYYGNATYSSRDNAIAGILTETFNEAPNTAANAIFVGYMVLRHNADFNTAASYEFRAAGLFRASGQGGGGGGGTTSPGGSSGQIQYNNAGAFGGVSTLIYDGTNLSATGSFSGSFTGSLLGIATTASYVNPLNQNVIITGSLTISGSSITVKTPLIYDDKTNVILGGPTTATTYGQVQISGSLGVGIGAGSYEIRPAAAGDTTFLKYIGTSLALGNTNSVAYGYTGGALGAIVSNLDNTTLLDVGRSSGGILGRVQITNSTNQNVRLALSSSNGYGVWLSTENTGSIGINVPVTTTPLYALDVSGSVNFRSGLIVTSSLTVSGSLTTLRNGLTVTGSLLTSGSLIVFTPSVVATSVSQSYFLITGSIQQIQTASAQVYGVNIAPTMIYTTGSQIQTALRVAPFFTGSAAFTSSQQNIVADFGAVGVGTQFSVNDITSGSIYMVNDVSGLPIIEALSDWTVNMYNYPTKVFQKTGSAIIISGSQTIIPSTGGSAVALIISGSNTKGGASYVDFLQVTNTTGSALTPTKYFRLDNSGSLQILRSDYGLNILQLSDAGNLYIYGATAAVTSNSDGISGSLMFNNNNSQIYDDGNMHIHSRTSGQSMWINTNNAPLNLLHQAPLSGGATGSGVAIGSGSLIGYVTINNGKSYTTSANYGYLTTAGAGTYPGGSQTVNISLYATQRIWGQEIDAFSDERMKDIQGEISLEDGLRLIKTLKPIKYTWKEGNDKGLKAGYSAQQVIKSGFDHLVGVIPKEGLEETTDNDGFVSPKDTQFSMNYDQVTPYHGVVIKHLLEKIEQLGQEIQLLKNK